MMRQISYIVGFALTLLSGICSAASGSHNPSGIRVSTETGIEEPAMLPGIIVVKLKSVPGKEFPRSMVSTAIPSLDARLREISAERLERLFPHHAQPPRGSGVRTDQEPVDLSRIYVVRYTSPENPISAAARIASDANVEYAEPHYIQSIEGPANDPKYMDGTQWSLPRIQVESAWDVTQGDSSVIIAIVDMGVDWAHPDLTAKIWLNEDEIPGNGVDDDLNGYVDDVRGWDFAGTDGDSPDNNPTPGNPHGTHVAGIAAAATNNAIGIAGVARGARLLPIKTGIDDPQARSILFGYEGIVYAADNGASVINCSWGGSFASQFEQEIVTYATQRGALVVAAAGNNNASILHFPSSYQNVLSVAATDRNDVRAYFSNYGSSVDISAPGVDIYSTYPNNSYSYLSGTSMASPIAAGVAALVRSIHVDWTPLQVGEQVRVSSENVDGVNPTYARELGYGRVNAFRAVSLNTPGVRLEDLAISDAASGNGNKRFEPGEVVSLTATFRNYLAPTSALVVSLSNSDPYVSLQSSIQNLGTIGTLQTKSLPASLTFQVAPDAPEDHLVLLDVLLTDGTYQDFARASFRVNQTFLDLETDNIVATVTSKGKLGYNDYPNNEQGGGFLFNVFENLLFEGAFMVGVDSLRVSDNARDATGRAADQDFISLIPISIESPGSIAQQEGVNLFDDSGAGTSQVGIQVTARTYSYQFTPDNDYFIVTYTIKNDASETYTNLHAGLYFDWDIGSVYTNEAGYDASQKLGYIYDTGGGSSSYAGATLLTSSTPNFWAIDNNHRNPGNPFGVWDGFTSGEKWRAMSSGVGNASVSGSDASFVIADGPLTVLPGGEVTVGFAVVGGSSLPDLQANANAARIRWNEISAGQTDRPPTFTQSPGSDVTLDESQFFSFQFQATDPDGDAVSYVVVSKPAGSSLSSAGLFTWTPTFNDAGDHSLKVAATDGRLSSFSSTTIHVRNVNRPPQFTESIADTTIDEGEWLFFDYRAFDPDNEPVRFRLVSPASVGVVLDSLTGRFSWTPSFSQSGRYGFSILTTDGVLSDTVLTQIVVRNMGPLEPPSSGIGFDRPDDQGYYVRLSFLRSINDSLSSYHAPDTARLDGYEILRNKIGFTGSDSLETILTSFYSMNVSDTMQADVPTYGDLRPHRYYVRAKNDRTQSPPFLVGEFEPIDNIAPAPIPAQSLRAYDDPDDNGMRVLITYALSPDDGESWSDGAMEYWEVTGYAIYRDGTLAAIAPRNDGRVSVEAGDRLKHAYSVAATDGVNESTRSLENGARAVDNTVRGDFNSDRVVEVSDLVMFASVFGSSTASDVEFDPLFDLAEPKDGAIDISDLAVFSSVFGAQAAPGNSAQNVHNPTAH